MKARDGMPADRVRELLNLDPQTGYLTRRVAPPHHPQRLGERVGTLRKDGYLEVSIERRSYLIHRLVWAHVHGAWPEGELDHKDLDKANNRPSNLRLATRQQNIINKGPNKNNRLGMKGVYARKYATGTKYRAGIVHDGKRIDLGTFGTADEAFRVYETAAKQFHGEFAYVSPA